MNNILLKTNLYFKNIALSVWYVLVISDGSCRIQFRTLHINTCISLWTVQNCILQLPSEITGMYNVPYTIQE